MACLKFELKDISRYQLQYPLTRSDSNLYMFTDSPLEAAHLTVDLIDSDSESFTFKRAFSGIPGAIVGFLSLTPDVGNVNVYLESLTATGGVVKTSAPVTARVVIHALYNP
jgi:hypothetical protein